MKRCSCCLEEKPYSEYYSNGKTPSGTLKYKPNCRVCFNQAVAITTQVKLDFVKTVFGNSCQVCGYDRCSSALDFHHLDPTTKDYKPTLILRNSATLETVKKELSNCLQLCANCHREVHAGVLDVSHVELKLKA